MGPFLFITACVPILGTTAQIPTVKRSLMVHSRVNGRDSVSDSLPPIRFVILDDYIRERLANDWDAHKNDRPLTERAYCLKWQLDIWAGEVAYRVTEISEPDSVAESDRTGILFFCKQGPNVAELHIHPDQTCISDDGPCWPDGPYSHQCIPSDADVRRLRHYEYKFSMIQCARDAEIFYWPTTYQ